MRIARLTMSAALIVLMAAPALAADEAARAAGEKLLAAYPQMLERVEDNDLVWRDGTRMALDDKRGPKSFDDWLADPDLKDMLALPYPTGAPTPPPRDVDPGRARNAAFFAKMYGDCTKDEVSAKLVDVVWLPKKWGKRLKVTSVNGAADKLAAISRALDELPQRFDAFLLPPAGTTNCRPIAGTRQASAHGYGIAIDIAVEPADYWRWHKPDAAGEIAYRNRIPMEIVAIFEANGFIWGGRWYHYDTMHFEYRPELLAGSAAPR